MLLVPLQRRAIQNDAGVISLPALVRRQGPQ